MKNTLCVCLFAFCFLHVYAEEIEPSISIARYYAIAHIHKAIVLHYKTMDQNIEPDGIKLFDNKEGLKQIAELLHGISSKGAIHKDWPLDIPTMQVVIMYDNKKYCILRVDNNRIQRPDGGGYGSGDLTEVQKLLAVLEMKAPNRPDASNK